MNNIVIMNCSNPTLKTLHLESDDYVDYRQGRQSCFDGDNLIKKCTSWHSWSYVLETEFLVYQKTNWQNVFKYDNVILLVNRDMNEVLPLLKKLKMMGKKVAISFHESPSDLVTGSGIPGENLFQRWFDLKQLVDEADFYINLFGQASCVFKGWFGKNKVKYCEHSFPYEWNVSFKKSWNERKYDILIGSRTFNQRLSRNTFLTLCSMNGLAKQKNLSVHFLCEDGVNANDLLKSLGLNNIVCHKGPLNFTEWLKFLSDFKYVVSNDYSVNLGQTTLDCAFLDVYNIGGITWNNSLLGTSDDGNLNLPIYDILDHEEINSKRDIQFQIDGFKKMTNSDIIKQKLVGMFA